MSESNYFKLDRPSLIISQIKKLKNIKKCKCKLPKEVKKDFDGKFTCPDCDKNWMIIGVSLDNKICHWVIDHSLD